jgi:SAM-dependent methyltransferase
VHAEAPIQRLQYRSSLVFLLGGFLGTSLNLALTLILHRVLGWNPHAAFFAGTIGNLLFHHCYYYVVFENREIPMKTPISLQLLLYLVVAGGAVALFHFFFAVVGSGVGASLLWSLAMLAAASGVFVRISQFGSATLANVEYREMNESFYDDQTDDTKVSALRAKYHRSRYRRLTEFVAEHYRPGMTITDLGCGNCWWNVHGVPVVGVDINEDMLRWALRNGRVAEYRVRPDLADTGLPTHHFDVVVMSEVLEHLLDVGGTLAEVDRILKDDGTFLVTVPYDIFLGPFFVLFNVNCLFQGYVRGSEYHRHRCGHVNHFTKRRLRRTLETHGFRVEKLFVVNGLLLYARTTKTARARLTP